MHFRHSLTIGLRKDALTRSQWQRLEATTGELEALPRRSPASAEALRTADCLLVDLGEPVDKAVLAKSPNLRYVGVFGTGYECVDAREARRRGIAVTNVPGYATEAVAEFTLAAMLAELRHLRPAWAPRRPGREEPPLPPGRELGGREVGVIGLGRIGWRVAELARVGFGARVSFWSRTRKPGAASAGFRYAALDNVLRRSEILSVNLALNGETRGLLNGRRTAILRPGAIVVCFAPIGVFEIEPLVARLRAGSLNLAIDDTEGASPSAVKTLRRLENVALYPPIGNTTEEASVLRQETFVSNVETFVAGHPTNVVDRESPRVSRRTLDAPRNDPRPRGGEPRPVPPRSHSPRREVIRTRSGGREPRRQA